MSFLSKLSFAQDPIAFQITAEEGLPNQTIYSIIQDKKGFIWLGTDAGLYRYDGIRYKEYKHPLQKSRSLTGLTLAKNGQLYMYNFNGQIFYFENDSLIFLSSWNKGTVSNICIDTLNQLWVTHNNGIDVFNRKTNKWTYYRTNSDDKSEGFTHSCFVEKDNSFWCIGPLGLVAIKNNRKTLFPVKWQDGKVSGEYHLAFNSKDKFIFSRLNGEVFKLVDGHVNSFYSKNLNPLLLDKKITRVEEDKNGRIWIYTFSGIVIYDVKCDSSNLYYTDKSFSSGICDDEKTYWLATLDDGLFKIPELNHKIWQINDAKNNNVKISKLKCSESFIAFSSSNGIVGSLNIKTNTTQLVALTTKLDIQGLALTEDKKDIIFSVQNSVFKTNQQKCNEIIKAFPPTKDIIEVNEHYIIATSRGAFCLSKNSSKPIQTLNELWCRAIAVNKEKNKLYIATNKGIDVFYKNYDYWVKVNTLLKDVQITSLYISENNKVYSLSYNGVIHQIENDNEPLILISLPENVNAHQVKTHKNKLYCATNKGLFIFNHKGELLQIVNRLSGLASDNINAFDIDSNYVWLASSKGIEQIPLNAKDKILASTIYLKGISVNNKLQELDKLLMLNYKQGFTVKLEAVSLSSENQFQYAYRLNTNDWVFLPASITDINIPYLNSGPFKLDIKLVNHLGNDSINTIVIKGYVEPPFWQRWWFYILSTLLVLGIAFLFFKYRLSKLKKKQFDELKRIQLENDLKLSQETALKARMNPHFIFNVLNSIKGYIYENDKKNATFYLSSFSDLVRKILNYSSSSEIKLQEEIEILKLYIELEAMLIQENFEYSISVDEHLDVNYIKIPALLIQPYIENSFKHGLRHKIGKKILTIDFKLSSHKQNLIVSITDNGIGREASHQLNLNTKIKHQSFATDATARRIELLNSNQKDIVSVQINDHLSNDNSSLGTSVILTIFLND